MNKRFFTSIGILAVLTLIFLFSGARLFLRNELYVWSAPLQLALWKAGSQLDNTLVAVTHVRALQKEASSLREENAVLKLEAASVKELQKENDALRKAQDISLAREYATIAADAVAKELSDDILVLNRGSGDGIAEGMPVITPSKMLVGRVIESAPGFSRVLLLSSKHSALDSKIAGREVLGVVKGKGAFQAFLDLIPQGSDIQKGDLVTTNRLSGMFPANLLVGVVTEVRAADADPFYHAGLSLSYSIGMPGPLLVITSYHAR